MIGKSISHIKMGMESFKKCDTKLKLCIEGLNLRLNAAHAAWTRHRNATCPQKRLHKRIAWKWCTSVYVRLVSTFLETVKFGSSSGLLPVDFRFSEIETVNETIRAFMGLMTGFIIFIMIGIVRTSKCKTQSCDSRSMYSRTVCPDSGSARSVGQSNYIWTSKVVFVWVVKRREERVEVRFLFIGSAITDNNLFRGNIDCNKKWFWPINGQQKTIFYQITSQEKSVIEEFFGSRCRFSCSYISKWSQMKACLYILYNKK